MFILDPGSGDKKKLNESRIWIRNTVVSVLDDLGLDPDPESAGLFRTKNFNTALTNHWYLKKNRNSHVVLWPSVIDIQLINLEHFFGCPVSTVMYGDSAAQMDAASDQNTVFGFESVVKSVFIFCLIVWGSAYFFNKSERWKISLKIINNFKLWGKNLQISSRVLWTVSHLVDPVC